MAKDLNPVELSRTLQRGLRPVEDGRATEAARKALAGALGVRPAAVSLRTGAASRDKLFTVERPTPGLTDVLHRLRDGSDG
ncbi:DUF167 domain-containing protein [Micromonospora sp. 4G55]|uniref:DUF167 domain-containing protein n=1 Tax=Micromonospora sp. 4G55 TaxID=2806102 RepID=UPI00278BC4B3|nr:DUF167 domain-containing protein [Micromonospora sp. 4G55]